MVMIHALLVAGSGIKPYKQDRVVGRWPSRRSTRIASSAPVLARGLGMDRSRTEAPKTRVYFTTHRSGAFPVLRLRAVVRGERASGSIVNRTKAGFDFDVVYSM